MLSCITCITNYTIFTTNYRNYHSGVGKVHPLSDPVTTHNRVCSVLRISNHLEVQTRLSSYQEMRWSEPNDRERFSCKIPLRSKKADGDNINAMTDWWVPSHNDAAGHPVSPWLGAADKCSDIKYRTILNKTSHSDVLMCRQEAITWKQQSLI